MAHNNAINPLSPSRVLNDNQSLNQILCHSIHDSKSQKLPPFCTEDNQIIWEDYIGHGEDGLVLKFRTLLNEQFYALKLFFTMVPVRDNIAVYSSVGREAVYYSRCFRLKSDFLGSLPSVPIVPLAWFYLDDITLTRQIEQQLQNEETTQTKRTLSSEETTFIFSNMCSEGWVAFDRTLLCASLVKSLPTCRSLLNFKESTVIGIIKPFILRKNWSFAHFERQTAMMYLQKSLGFFFYDFNQRNWVNGILVDPADLVYPGDKRFLDYWVSSFYQLIVQTKADMKSG